MKNPTFGPLDVGCFIDGGLGNDYLRRRLAGMLDVYFDEYHTHFEHSRRGMTFAIYRGN